MLCELVKPVMTHGNIGLSRLYSTLKPIDRYSEVFYRG